MSEPKSIGASEEKPLTKVCAKCGQEKSLELFQSNKRSRYGRGSCCKMCCAAAFREYYRRYPDRIKLTRRKPKGPLSEMSPEKREKSRTRNAHQNRLYRSSKNKRNMEWEKRTRHKRQAHRDVRRAIAKGTLVRPANCAKCGVAGKIEASHSDYSKPLDVEWLCTLCHANKDRAARQSLRLLVKTE
jgi:hypothetical protein